ncbi:hypothetical protein [Streptomyces acidiscabies]|uniref:Uncharacterized protein n=3 Tax=Streptomyces acidiscabies TaxID=42234 RepID=A0AAP6EFL0_9ACTN|nr:hypothetical protein [Streptomyces acidiscabies]MBP5935628.1 hypothetical protein [Streptomyces sp. LBUM 1476]MBZ3916485.1 hypothetical protein [Streptomyces acidiscabies]MDX2961142.1 hypothetical protein [Streptomyces acidiscabies]MDX3022904.1 hypothetical protein [Streptomyces acidiscabies]MDX3791849.1 hypothetical protein [Streptomyces acidiscabies]
MTSPVIVLDLRQGASGLTDAAGLRSAVAERLREVGRPEPADGHYRFLIVDTPAGLGLRHSVYERVIAYGKRTSVLALAVGELTPPPEPPAPTAEAWDPLAGPWDFGPGDGWGASPGSATAPAYAPADPWNPGAPDPARPTHHGPRLTRPAALRGEGCGLLWAGDLRAARTAGDPDVTPDDPRALSVLVDVLCGLFDDVLDRLAALTDSAAVPAVRFLEHDLSPAARDRAWTDALLRLAGDTEQPLPEGVLDLGDLLSGTGADVRATPGGRLDRSRRRCADTLAALARARRTGAAPDALADAVEALERHRALIVEVLRFEDPPTADVTVAPSALTREDLARALRVATEQLLDRGTPLRAVAAQLVALGEEIVPAASTEAVSEADRRCSPDRIAAITSHQPYPVRPSLPLALLAGAASGLVPLGAPVVLAAIWAGLRNLRAGLLATAAFVPGVAAGVLAARALDLPAWTPVPALTCGLLAALLLARLGRRAAADAWWRTSGADGTGRILTDLDAALAEGAARRWWAAGHRRDLADLARAAAGVLRAAADTAQECAGVPRPRQGAYDSLGEGLRLVPPELLDPPTATGADVPRWLGREAGEGGPALVATLRDDLDAAVRTTLSWSASRTRGDVRALFDAARRHIDRHGVVAPSPHRPDRERPDTEALLGVAARESDDDAADTADLVELVTPKQSALLSKDPGQARRIRFAPHTARRPAWAADQPVLFPGRYSGTLRLTPLRHGVIDTVRRTAAAADTEDTW